MIKVNICGVKQVYDSSLASWINEQHHNRKRSGADFWFIVTVDVSGINLSFPSASAPHGSGVSYSHFNHREKKIIDMWNQMGVKQDNDVSNLLRFLSQLERAVA